MNTKSNVEVGLEDNHEDILTKAVRGLGLDKTAVAAKLGLERSRIEGVLNGGSDDEVIRGMAALSNLDPDKLIVSARKNWAPAPLQLGGVKQFNLPFGSMLVNAYLLWSEKSKKAWLFDTGPQVSPILEFLELNGLSINAIFLTHTHGDHIACLDELKQKTGNPSVFVHKLESIEGAESIEEGFEYEHDDLTLKSLHTHGHSVGGMTFLIDGLNESVAVVGDALFAGSMGGGMVSYEDALRNNREKIMTLPDRTVVCPGHGPITTIAEEKKHNPFFPEFS
jgi:glyoxylase-like metal-dependent hydrolase (beta-lactamase superfamily II)